VKRRQVDGELLKTFALKNGVQLSFSTIFHPQINGQIERVNGLLNQYLKNYVSANQRD
jgi:transposase InsO family protein